MITETVVDITAAPKLDQNARLLGAAQSFFCASDYYLTVKDRIEATVVSARSDGKVGTVLVTEADSSKNDVIFFDGISPFAVTVTTRPDCENLDLNKLSLAWQITHDRLFYLRKDIFPDGNPLMAAVVTNSPFYQTANTRLVANLSAELNGRVEFVNITNLYRALPGCKFSTSFNAVSGELNVYDWTGDRGTSFATIKLPGRETAKGHYAHYLEYMRNCGVLTYPHFIESLTLTPRQIFDRHPASVSGLTTGGENIDDKFMMAQALAVRLGREAEQQTGVEMGPDEWPIWLKLRLILKGEMETYRYGWRPPNLNGERVKFDYRNPGDLAGAVLLDEIFKITGNKLKGKQVADWFARNLPETNVDIVPLPGDTLSCKRSLFRPFTYGQDQG